VQPITSIGKNRVIPWHQDEIVTAIDPYCPFVATTDIFVIFRYNSIRLESMKRANPSDRYSAEVKGKKGKGR
jgi:hypothetical protein